MNSDVKILSCQACGNALSECDETKSGQYKCSACGGLNILTQSEEDIWKNYLGDVKKLNLSELDKKYAGKVFTKKTTGFFEERFKQAQEYLTNYALEK